VGTLGLAISASSESAAWTIESLPLTG